MMIKRGYIRFWMILDRSLTQKCICLYEFIKDKIKYKGGMDEVWWVFFILRVCLELFKSAMYFYVNGFIRIRSILSDFFSLLRDL